MSVIGFTLYVPAPASFFRTEKGHVLKLSLCLIFSKTSREVCVNYQFQDLVIELGLSHLIWA